jgi:hypothetical protein
MSVSEIRFALPEGLTDHTIYVFASDNKDFLQQEDVRVGHDRVPDGVRDLNGLVQNRLGELKAVAPGELKVTEDVPATLGAVPARRLDIVASSQGMSIRTLVLLALLADGTYMQISCKVRLRDAEAIGRLDHIAQSLRSTSQEAGPAAPGFVRRRAGEFSLEVPSNLRPPSDYLFLFPRGQGRVEMQVWRLGDPNLPAPISSLVAQDTAIAERVDSEPAQSLMTAVANIQIVRYTMTEKELDRDVVTAVWRARVQFRSGTVASVTARCGEQFRAQVDSRFAAFVNSLREE